MKFIEFGIGKQNDKMAQSMSNEVFVKLLKPVSFYVRTWIGKTVLIADTKEGFKKTKKTVENSNCYLALEAYNIKPLSTERLTSKC